MKFYLSPVLQALLFINFVVPLLKHSIHTLLHPVLIPLVVCNFIILCPLAVGEYKEQLKYSVCNFTVGLNGFKKIE